MLLTVIYNKITRTENEATKLLRGTTLTSKEAKEMLQNREVKHTGRFSRKQLVTYINWTTKLRKLDRQASVTKDM